jgi:hypothetical protein
MAEDSKGFQPRKSLLTRMSPPPLKIPEVLPAMDPPRPLDLAEAHEHEKPVTWWRMAAAMLGGMTAVPAVLAPTPAVAVVKVVEPTTDPDAGWLQAVSLARTATPDIGFESVGETLKDAVTVRLEITVEIDGVPEDRAGEIAGTVHAAAEEAAARVLEAGEGGAVLAVDSAPDKDDGGWTLVYGFVGPTVKVVRAAGEIVGAIGKVGLGVYGGRALVRRLKGLSVTPADEKEEGALSVTATIEPEATAKKDASGGKDALKEVKEVADGLIGAADLLARAAG